MINKRSFIIGIGGSILIPQLSFSKNNDSIKMRDLYNKDLSFSELALQNKDKRISVLGYMAPPLKANSKFFVLTRRPMAVCPFCEKEADWPDDILAIYTKRIIDIEPFNRKIVVEGTLRLDTYKDDDTGFVSRVRLENTSYNRI